MEKIIGYVEHIVFRNEDNGYTVFHLHNEDGDLTCVGMFHYISEGEFLEVSGEYTNHAVYGSQLQVQEYRVKEPEDLHSIEVYLGSGAIKGLGSALAGRIVRKFKGDTFRIIEEEPERLAEIKGISERMAREIAVQVEEKKEMRQAMLYLQKYGISTTLRDQRENGKRDCSAGRREEGNATGNVVFAEIWYFNNTCGKDLSALWTEHLSRGRTESVSAGRSCRGGWI